MRLELLSAQRSSTSAEGKVGDNASLLLVQATPFVDSKRIFDVRLLHSTDEGQAEEKRNLKRSRPSGEGGVVSPVSVKKNAMTSSYDNYDDDDDDDNDDDDFEQVDAEGDNHIGEEHEEVGGANLENDGGGQEEDDVVYEKGTENKKDDPEEDGDPKDDEVNDDDDDDNYGSFCCSDDKSDVSDDTDDGVVASQGHLPETFILGEIKSYGPVPERGAALPTFRGVSAIAAPQEVPVAMASSRLKETHGGNLIVER